MRIKNISLKNYRLLDNISVNLEDDITLIVGKNNTGKTSFLEAIKTFTSMEGKLSFEDFSQTSYAVFKECYGKYVESIQVGIADDKKEELELFIQNTVPKVELSIEFEYVEGTDLLIELSEFITDLDDARNDATVLISYESKNSLSLFSAFHNRQDAEIGLMKYLKENAGIYYRLTCYAHDKKSGFKREIEGNYKEKIKKIVTFEDIKALRILDDKKGDRNNTLALGFSKYYNERDKTDENVEAIEKSLKDIAKELKTKYNIVLSKILEDLKKFGASTPVVIPDITIASEFNSESVIKNNIKYYYKQDEIDLPESYNGLGYSNLIYMILELASFIERFRNSKEEKISEFLTVLIEEPEAHMHPQMQQVFISQIKGLISDAKKENINIQLVLTSHSSHILSEAGIDEEKGFNRIRYFNKIDCKIETQDFNFLKIKDDKKTFRFLKQYLTLHKSDLFFSDKVILVEGTTERMLLPQMIKKVAPSIQNEYVTILEVGGAYTHKFKELLDFIKVKTLIITDIDSVDATQGKKCEVGDGTKGELTSNETLKQWLPAKEKISELIAVTENEKIENELIRIAYQTIENGIIGRSFEEAFINCNKTLLLTTKETDGGTKSAKNEFSLLRTKSAETVTADLPFALAPEGSKAKTNFAFDAMSFQEDLFGEWTVPQYIKDGLEWLAGMCIVSKKG